MVRKKFISWIMLFVWMGVIFYMSHQPGEVSSSQSEIVIKFFSMLGISLDLYFGELATLILRKLAHFTEYFILFILLYRVIRLYVRKEHVKWYAISIVFLYACSDEIHQYFIPGRGPAFRDVLIDTFGGLVALIISYFFESKKKLLNKE